MAKHNGCPGCQNLYNGYSSIGQAEQEGNGEQQRAESSGKSSAQTSPTTVYNPFYTGRPRTPAGGAKHTPIDRQEIIRRIKSGGSRPTSPELERPASRSSLKKLKSPTTPEQALSQPSEHPLKTPEAQPDNQSIGLEIERPRSALHRGDFREKTETSSAFERFGEADKEEPAPSLSTSPPAPWHPGFPSAALRRFQQGPSTPYQRPEIHSARSRAVSTASLASTFVYKPPTSPLVQASRPDTPEPPTRRASRSPDKSRRRTFSPEYLQRFNSSALDYPTSARHYGHHTTPHPPTLRSERTYPYQAHQPRRSLNSFASLPQTPSRTRRPSLSESPLQHATMVGSYEESILRGRMSTTPSKPLNFVAQIGVLGKGDCKASLRCPPHATVPFPAVFYSYGSGARAGGGGSDQPSPYVGLVDLENTLPSLNGNRSTERRRQRQQQQQQQGGGNHSDSGSRASSLTRNGNANENYHSTSDNGAAGATQARLRIRQKQKRRSGSPKAPPGGSYRIPQQGQLQIVIKNPNKTAVKLFLVPYDLSDMEAGQKTFIRQRSYSAGPIIDFPVSSSSPKSSGPDGPDKKAEVWEERPTLRYLVHLHICCPAKGRYFLYKSIRVVFANRVPDGKEKLRNEIQLPEPKYSSYKPGRDSNVGLPGGGGGAQSTATPREPAGVRRRSALETPLASSLVDDDAMEGRAAFSPFMAQSLPATEFASSAAAQMNMPIHPNPFSRAAMPTIGPRPAMLGRARLPNGIAEDPEQPSNDVSNPTRARPAYASPALVGYGNGHEEANGVPGARKLDEPFSFESREQKPGKRSESLLSRRLREFALQAQSSGNGEVEEQG